MTHTKHRSFILSFSPFKKDKINTAVSALLLGVVVANAFITAFLLGIFAVNTSIL